MDINHKGLLCEVMAVGLFLCAIIELWLVKYNLFRRRDRKRSSTNKGENTDIPSADESLLLAPIWTPEQVIMLLTRQNNQQLHPYTCPNHGDGKHISDDSSYDVLLPTVNGWICPFCDYRQTWAHEIVDNKNH